MEKLSDGEKLEAGWLHVRAILEIVGKPKEHVEKTLKDYIAQIRQSKDFEVVSDHTEEAVEKENLFTTFSEIEFWTQNTQKLTGFCFDFMPSSIEILEPEKMIVKSSDLTDLFNDLQARLHHVDMLAKNLFQENKAFNASINHLVRNIILISLSHNSLGKEQLVKLTGVNEEKIAPFLDKLVEEKRIELKEGKYSIVKKEK